jgi:hypothetical protein
MPSLPKWISAGLALNRPFLFFFMLLASGITNNFFGLALCPASILSGHCINVVNTSAVRQKYRYISASNKSGC